MSLPQPKPLLGRRMNFGLAFQLHQGFFGAAQIVQGLAQEQSRIGQVGRGLASLLQPLSGQLEIATATGDDRNPRVCLAVAWIEQEAMLPAADGFVRLPAKVEECADGELGLRVVRKIAEQTSHHLLHFCRQQVQATLQRRNRLGRRLRGNRLRGLGYGNRRRQVARAAASRAADSRQRRPCQCSCRSRMEYDRVHPKPLNSTQPQSQQQV